MSKTSIACIVLIVLQIAFYLHKWNRTAPAAFSVQSNVARTVEKVNLESSMQERSFIKRLDTPDYRLRRAIFGDKDEAAVWDVIMHYYAQNELQKIGVDPANLTILRSYQADYSRQ